MTSEVLGSIQVALALTLIILVIILLILFLRVINKLVEAQTRRQPDFDVLELKIKEILASEIELIRTESLPTKPPKSFGSYSRKDSHYAELIRIAVLGLGSELCLDVTHVRGGTKWKSEIERLINEANEFILLWSKNASSSKWVKEEIEIALAKEIEGFVKIFRWQPIEPPENLSDIQATFIPLREVKGSDGSIKLVFDFKPRLSFIQELPKQSIITLVILTLITTCLAFYGIRTFQDWAFTKVIEPPFPRKDKEKETKVSVVLPDKPDSNPPIVNTKPLSPTVPNAKQSDQIERIMPGVPSTFSNDNKSILFSLPSGFNFRQWSEDGNFMLTARAADRVQLWNVETGSLISILPIITKALSRGETGIVWTERGARFCVIDEDGQIGLWNGTTGEKIRQLPVEVSSISDHPLWSPNGNVFVTRNSSLQLQMWDGATGLEIGQLPMSIGLLINYGFWSPNGKVLAVRTDDRQILLWNGITGREIGLLPVTEPSVLGFFFNPWAPTGDVLLTQSDNGEIQLWNGMTGQEIAKLSTDNGQLDIKEKKWSPNGKVLSTRNSNGQIQLWDGVTGQEIRQLPVFVDRFSKDCFWSPNGEVLLTRSRSLEIQLWNGQTGQEIAKLSSISDHKYVSGEALRFPQADFLWSPNGKVFLTRSDSGQIELWDGTNGRKIKQLPIEVESIDDDYNCFWSSNGKVLFIITKDRQIELWNGATGIKIKTLSAPIRAKEALSPDGQILVAGRLGGKMELWQVETGTKIRNLPIKFLPFGYNWSPNGKVLAISRRGKIQFWRIKQ